MNALNANLDDVAFIDKADDTASRGLRRDMTDVFALAGGGGNDYLRAREVSYPLDAG